MLVVLALVVTATSLPAAKAAVTAPTPGTYEGTTSQGYGLSFVVQPGSPEYIESWGISFTLTCRDTGRQFGVGHGFFGFNPPIVDDKFTFEYLDTFFWFKWRGRFTTQTHAEGTAMVRWAVMIDAKKIERCDSGSVTWTADLTTE